MHCLFLFMGAARRRRYKSEGRSRMSITHRVARALLLPVFVLATCGGICPATAADSPGAVPSREEIAGKRAEVREKLMVPSLAGIRGLAYGLVGFENADQLEKTMGEKLSKLAIKTTPFGQLKEGTEPVDALVHVHLMKLGKFAVAELSVSQWSTLARNPKSKVRAITYRNRVFVPAASGDQAVAELTDQLVSDFEKANKNATAAAPQKSTPAPKKAKK